MSTENIDDNESNDNDASAEEVDILSMGDDEVDAYYEKQLVNQEKESDDGKDDESGQEEDDSSNEDEDDSDESDSDDDSDDDDESDDSDADDDDEDESDEDSDDDDSGDDEEAGDEEDPDKDEDKDSKSDTKELKSFKKELFAPLRANGKDLNIDSISKMRTLAEMGAGFNKKMVDLKPHLKKLKMLEQNDILDEAKLTYLIDLSKHDPKAIAKLVSDAGIDPLDLTTASTDYEPKDYSVSDSQVDLDQALDKIEYSDTRSKTIDVISNQWDAQSRATILNAPQIIGVIDEQMQSGIFDKVVAEVEKEKMFGGLSGLSDIEAYKLVGSKMQKAGAFGDGQPQGKKAAKGGTRKAVKNSDKKRINKKKSAGNTKSSPSKKKQDMSKVNPLSMSDADFDKYTAGLLS